MYSFTSVVILPLMNSLVEPAARTKLSLKMWRAPDSDMIFLQVLGKANSIWNDTSVTKLLSNYGDSSACIWRANLAIARS